MALKVLQVFSHIECQFSSQYWSIDDLRWFVFIISYSCHFLNHIRFTLSNSFMILFKKRHLKKTPEKSVFALLTVKYLGHEIGFNTIKSSNSKTTANFESLSPTTKSALMMIIVSLNFYYKILQEVSVKMIFCLLYSMILSGSTDIMNDKHCFNKINHILQKMLLYRYLLQNKNSLSL